ncbi:hypothetical protein [Paenibacillus sp. R14(2021)]|uniref:hypothetical protein n=1 Tax=Paenibacillus sp. R14(2021) TaxID=2859228 RepID=UPI001C615FB0|nr:hypothetical protein [Paenibacillus sp. R14(2021)]
MSKKRVMIGTLALAAAISLAGCGHKDATNNYNADSYGHDGYMGLSNSNPHLPNRNGSFLNYVSDGKFAQRQLKQVQGIDKVSMMFQGPNMYVTIKARPGFDAVQIRQKAIAVLRYNMPRYTVHVKTTP